MWRIASSYVGIFSTLPLSLSIIEREFYPVQSVLIRLAAQSTLNSHNFCALEIYAIQNWSEAASFKLRT